MPINRVPKRIWGVVFGTPFWCICDWYLTFSCPKHGPGAAPDRPDSVCLCVCLSVCPNNRFPRPVLDQVDGRTTHFSEKRRSKTGSHPACAAEMDHFRCHLAEVVALSSSGDCGATFPLGLIGGVAVVNVHLSGSKNRFPPEALLLVF